MDRESRAADAFAPEATFILNETHALIYPLVVGDEFALGRSVHAEIRVQHDTVARRHTLVRVHETAVEISDIASTTGTRVDGIEIDQIDRPLGSSFEMMTGEVRWRVFSLRHLGSVHERYARMALETAMAHELSWSHETMQRYLGDGAVREWLRNLVFTVDTRDERRLVRWTEEGFLDIEAATVDVTPDASFRPTHPVELSAAERRRWQQNLADFELIQPFDQLAREVHEDVLNPPTVVFDEQNREQFFAHGWQVRWGNSMYVSCRFPTHQLTVGGAVEPGEPVNLWFRGDVDSIPPVVFSESYRALGRIAVGLGD